MGSAQFIFKVCNNKWFTISIHGLDSYIICIWILCSISKHVMPHTHDHSLHFYFHSLIPFEREFQYWGHSPLLPLYDEWRIHLLPSALLLLLLWLVADFEARFVSDFAILAILFAAPLLASDFEAPFLAIDFVAPCFGIFNPSVFVEVFVPLEAPFWATLPSFFPPVDALGTFSLGICRVAVRNQEQRRVRDQAEI
jgi:hypothetical protein